MKRKLAALGVAGLVFLGAAGSALLGTCGPFSDVADDAMCPLVEEIFYLGITNGTTPTTYDPSGDVTRLQMAAFLSRTVDSVLRRGSRRAALGQFWTPQDISPLTLTTVGGGPTGLQSDGADIWVAKNASISRVRASDGRLLETWTGSNGASNILIAMGKVFASGFGPVGGRLYRIDPAEPVGTVTRVVSSGIGLAAGAMTFDGAHIWVTGAESGSPGSVYLVTPGPTLPWAVTTAAGSFVDPRGLAWDGTNVWATDYGSGTILRLDAAGAVLQTVTVQSKPLSPLFDGTNLWVPNWNSGSVSIVRAATGAILATVTGNGLWAPVSAAFDGERVLVVNGAGDRVSLFKAADFSPLTSFYTGENTAPWGACSDGVYFWISMNYRSAIARF